MDPRLDVFSEDFEPAEALALMAPPRRAVCAAALPAEQTAAADDFEQLSNVSRSPISVVLLEAEDAFRTALTR